MHYYHDSLLGSIFAGGNLPNSYNAFEKEHRCNKYCRFFRLPTDYNNWGDAEDALHSMLGNGKEKDALESGMRSKDMSISKGSRLE